MTPSFFTSSISAIVNTVKDAVSNGDLITTVLAVIGVSAAVWMKKKNKTQKKALRKLKWKMRWAFLKSFFRKGDVSYVLAVLLAIGLIVVLIIYGLWWLAALLLVISIAVLIAQEKR